MGIVENGDYFFDNGSLIVGDGRDALVAQYGEENATYIYDMMRPKLNGKLQPIYFIDVPEIDAASAKKTCREKAEAEGREFRELTGSLRLIRMLLAGEHPETEFLTVTPGETIQQTGDWNQIIKAERAPPYPRSKTAPSTPTIHTSPTPNVNKESQHE